MSEVPELLAKKWKVTKIDKAPRKWIINSINIIGSMYSMNYFSEGKPNFWVQPQKHILKHFSGTEGRRILEIEAY